MFSVEINITRNVVNFIISAVRCEDMKCTEMKLHLFKQNYVLSNRSINPYVPHLQLSKK